MSEKTKAELLEEAREKEIEGRSSMNKDELAAAVEDADGGDGSVSEGGDEVRDAVDLLTPTGESVDNESTADERLEEIEEDAPETAKLAAVTMDSHGPLILQDPSERIMTGAVSEEHAKEQEKLLKNKPEDHVGDVTEAGFDSEGNPA